MIVTSKSGLALAQTSESAEENASLLDDRRAPQELLHGESGDRHHRHAAILELLEPHVLQIFAGRQAKRVELVITVGAQTLANACELGSRGEAKECKPEQTVVLEEASVEEGGRPAVQIA